MGIEEIGVDGRFWVTWWSCSRFLVATRGRYASDLAKSHLEKNEVFYEGGGVRVVGVDMWGLAVMVFPAARKKTGFAVCPGRGLLGHVYRVGRWTLWIVGHIHT